MTIPIAKPPLIEGKRGLIGDIASDQSIAWGCVKSFLAFGVNLAFFLGQKRKMKLC